MYPPDSLKYAYCKVNLEIDALVFELYRDNWHMDLWQVNALVASYIDSTTAWPPQPFVTE